MQNCLLLICDTGAILTVDDDDWSFPFAPEIYEHPARIVPPRTLVPQTPQRLRFKKQCAVPSRGVHIYVQL